MKIRFLVNIDWFFLSHRLELYKSFSKKFKTSVLAGFSGKKNDFEFDYFETKGRIPTIKGFKTIVKIVKREAPSTLFIVVSPVMIFLFHIFFLNVKYAVYNFSGLGEFRNYPKLVRFIILKIFQIIPIHGKRLIVVQNSDDKLLFQKLCSKTKRIEVTQISGSGYLSENKFNFINSNNFRVGYVGRIRKDKGILSLIRAFQELEKVYSDVELVIWGDLDDPKRHGFNMDELIELESNKKYFKGFSGNKQTIYNSFDWFCLPSNGEGLSKSAIEATAFSKILLLSNVPGNRDMINQNGFLFNYNQEQDILSTLRHSYNINLDDRKQMAMNSFKLYKNKWQYSVIEKQWVKIISKIHTNQFLTKSN